LRRENELATLPVDLRDPRFPLLLISPRLREPELLHVKIDGHLSISATNSTSLANHSLLMTFCSPFAVIEFGIPPTASHKNNCAKLVRALLLID
jgi:hypothetical protein